RMMATFARIDPEVDRVGAAAAEIDGRALRRQARSIGRNQHIGGKARAVVSANLAQARRARLLAHLDQPFEIEAEPAARCEDGADRGKSDRVLALVVDDAAPVVAALGLGELPRAQTLAPAGIEAADHVAMAVAEHGRQAVVLDALAEQEWSARLGMSQNLAA